jgi:hypothetical protein
MFFNLPEWSFDLPALEAKNRTDRFLIVTSVWCMSLGRIVVRYILGAHQPESRCLFLRRCDRVREAIAELSRIIAANPNSFYPLTLRGELYLESSRAPQAVFDDFSDALKLLQADRADPLDAG